MKYHRTHSIAAEALNHTSIQLQNTTAPMAKTTAPAPLRRSGRQTKPKSNMYPGEEPSTDMNPTTKTTQQEVRIKQQQIDAAAADAVAAKNARVANNQAAKSTKKSTGNVAQSTTKSAGNDAKSTTKSTRKSAVVSSMCIIFVQNFLTNVSHKLLTRKLLTNFSYKTFVPNFCTISYPIPQAKRNETSSVPNPPKKSAKHKKTHTVRGRKYKKVSIMHIIIDYSTHHFEFTMFLNYCHNLIERCS